MKNNQNRRRDAPFDLKAESEFVGQLSQLLQARFGAVPRNLRLTFEIQPKDFGPRDEFEYQAAFGVMQHCQRTRTPAKPEHF